MAVINIMKNGTVVDDMSKVTVPREVVKKLASLKEARMKEKEKKGNGNAVNHGRQGNN